MPSDNEHRKFHVSHQKQLNTRTRVCYCCLSCIIPASHRTESVAVDLLTSTGGTRCRRLRASEVEASNPPWSALPPRRCTRSINCIFAVFSLYFRRIFAVFSLSQKKTSSPRLRRVATSLACLALRPLLSRRADRAAQEAGGDDSSHPLPPIEKTHSVRLAPGTELQSHFRIGTEEVRGRPAS